MNIQVVGKREVNYIPKGKTEADRVQGTTVYYVSGTEREDIIGKMMAGEMYISHSKCPFSDIQVGKSYDVYKEEGFGGRLYISDFKLSEGK